MIGHLLIAISLGGLLGPLLQPETREGEAGMARYRDGDYVGAVEHFRKAAEHDPDARWDLATGNAAFRADNFELAGDAFTSALRHDADPGSGAYNLGNARFRAGEFEEALGAYREALRADPGHEDARFNYELALRQIEQQEQQDQDQDQQDQQPPQDQDGEQQDQEQDGQGDPPPEGQEQQPAPPEDGEQPKDQEGEPQDPSEGGEQTPPNGDDANPQDTPGTPQPGDVRPLTPQEAARLLDAVTPEERELLKSRLQARRKRHVEKDW